MVYLMCALGPIPTMSETQALKSSIVSKCVYRQPLADRSLISHHNFLDVVASAKHCPFLMDTTSSQCSRANELESLKSSRRSGLSAGHEMQKSLHVAWEVDSWLGIPHSWTQCSFLPHVRYRVLPHRLPRL